MLMLLLLMIMYLHMSVNVCGYTSIVVCDRDVATEIKRHTPLQSEYTKDKLTT